MTLNLCFVVCNAFWDNSPPHLQFLAHPHLRFLFSATIDVWLWTFVHARLHGCQGFGDSTYIEHTWQVLASKLIPLFWYVKTLTSIIAAQRLKHQEKSIVCTQLCHTWEDRRSIRVNPTQSCIKHCPLISVHPTSSLNTAGIYNGHGFTL